MNRHFNYWHFLILTLGAILFLGFQLTMINRPYYWDEAWSYASAVKAMYESGPSLMPGAIHEYLYRGHPTFFYFFTTLWMKVFGPSLVSVHSFFVLISVLLIFCIFFIGKSLFNKTTGLLAALMLMVTPMFIAQAGFLLPEVLLALLTVLTFWAYLKKKIVAELFFGSILALTKETGLLLIFVILLFEFISAIKALPKSKKWFIPFKPLFLHAIPVFVALTFYLVQKIKMGWFFYPEHVGMMTFNLEVSLAKLEMITRLLLKKQGRNILTILSIAGIIYLVAKKKLPENEKRFLLLSVVFIFAYLVFSAFNFFTNRYLLSLFPIFFLSAALILTRLFEKQVYTSLLVTIIFAGISLKATIKDDSLGDDNLGFQHMVKVHQEAVKFSEEAEWQQKKIQTHFLMVYNLREPFMGYITRGKAFKHVNAFNEIDNADVVIISAIEAQPEIQTRLKPGGGFNLAKRFESKNAWCEIYIKDQNFSPN